MDKPRPGILSEHADRALCVLMITLFVVDFSQVSYWTGPVKPFGGAQRWVTVAVQAGYIAVNAAGVLRLLPTLAPLLALTGFCAASALWSLDPATSLLGAARLLILALSILAAQDRHGPDLVARVFLAVCSAVLVANLLSLGLPGIAIMSGTLAGAFRGLTDHKNTLGQFCALTLAFALAACVAARSRPQAYRLAALCLALAVTVALTRSATAVVLCATAAGIVAIGTVLHRTRLPILAAVLILIVAAPVILLAATGPLNPFQLLGRDATLTGRAEIWAFVDLYVQQRPWLGYGFRAFPLSDLLRADPRWGLDSFVVGSTHNAYLAILTEIGRVGLAAYVAWLVLFVARAFPRHGLEPRLRAAAMLGVYLVSGLSESAAGLSPSLCLAALLIAVHRAPSTVDERSAQHAKVRLLQSSYGSQHP